MFEVVCYHSDEQLVLQKLDVGCSPDYFVQVLFLDVEVHVVTDQSLALCLAQDILAHFVVYCCFAAVSLGNPFLLLLLLLLLVAKRVDSVIERVVVSSRLLPLHVDYLLYSGRIEWYIIILMTAD